MARYLPKNKSGVLTEITSRTIGAQALLLPQPNPHRFLFVVGTFTIPLMKSSGFKPHVAGGIEAAASSGGALVPPIMGAVSYRWRRGWPVTSAGR